MTYNFFYESLDDYYGKHENDVVLKMVRKYVESKYNETELPELRASIYLDHPISWGSPDIAAINKAHKEYKKDKELEKKAESEVKKESNIFHQDLSITDDEWKQGFKGMEALKKAVHSEDLKKTHPTTHIPKCSDCKYHPIQTNEGFEESKECIDCGEYHANFND